MACLRADHQSRRRDRPCDDLVILGRSQTCLTRVKNVRSPDGRGTGGPRKRCALLPIRHPRVNATLGGRRLALRPPASDAQGPMASLPASRARSRLVKTARRAPPTLRGSSKLAPRLLATPTATSVQTSALRGPARPKSRGRALRPCTTCRGRPSGGSGTRSKDACRRCRARWSPTAR